MSIENDTFKALPPSELIDQNWHITNSYDTCVAHCFGFAHDVQSGENLAKRIVAALNACRGMSTAFLEKQAQGKGRCK